MDQLESALLLTLRDTLRWESALSVYSTGTLVPVDPAANFNALTYQQRDRELAYRDLIVSAAVNEIAVRIDEIWHYTTNRPRLQGPVPSALPHAATEITATGSNYSWVRHVQNSSIPLDAARCADADLYGRDLLLYEVLARACAQVFTESPIQSVDSTIISTSGSFAWSLANGSEARSDINAALPLNRDLFRLPDEHLADRDNLLAAYVARLAQVLKNPFEYALRLYVIVTGPGSREAEVYALTSDDGSYRTWRAEPALSNRNQIIYDIEHKKLQWTRDEVDEVHVPQLYALAIPGIEAGQVLTTLPAVPEQKDAQFWRQKAGQAIPEGEQVSDTNSSIRFTNDVTKATGGIMQSDAVSFTVPGQSINLYLPGILPSGSNYRLNLLVRPKSSVSILGAQNTSVTNGTLGGATYEIDVASGNIIATTYFVEGGDGIIYHGGVYAANANFAGVNGITTYAQVNSSYPSTVRQYGLNFNLALPPGAWKFSLDYTNLTYANTDGFGCLVQYAASGNTVTIVQDTAPLPFNTVNGNVLTSAQANLDVSDASAFNLKIFWTYGTGQFHVRQINFTQNVVAAGSYALTVPFGGTNLNANVSGLDNLVEEIRFQGTLKTTITSPTVSVAYTQAASMPILIEQVAIQSIGTYAATPNAHEFQGWRQECLDRAERVIQQGYNLALQAYGSNVPTFRDSGSILTRDGLENWMAFVEVKNPRLREIAEITQDELVAGRQYEITTAPVGYGGSTYLLGDKFYCTYQYGSEYTDGEAKQIGALIKSQAGHTGRPALIPQGLFFGGDDSSRAYWDTPHSVPIFVACQPWMIDLGVYVAQEDFWTPDFIDNIAVLVPTTGVTPEPPLPTPP